MTDFYIEVGVSRDDVAGMLTQNPEHILFVLSAVLSAMPADDIIESGELAEHADVELVAFNLAMLAKCVAHKQETR